MQRSSSNRRQGVIWRARRPALALGLLAAAAMGATACGTATRLAGPGGPHVTVQETRLGMTLRTDRGNTVTVTAYRSAIDRAGHEGLSHGTHFEAAEVSICARASGGVVGPSLVTLRTINNRLVLATESRPIAPQLKSQRLSSLRSETTTRVPGRTAAAGPAANEDDSGSLHAKKCQLFGSPTG